MQFKYDFQLFTDFDSFLYIIWYTFELLALRCLILRNKGSN